MIFVLKYVFKVVFEDGILGGMRNFWGNSYLNSMTILFDVVALNVLLKETITLEN